MIGPVSAVLLSWRRPYNIPIIISHLRKFPQIAEIVIWCNESSIDADFILPGGCENYLRRTANYCTLGRFMAAASAQYDTILVQDDDLLTLNIPALLDYYDGTQIIANLADDSSSKHWQFWQRDPKPYVELGFGSIFPKQFAIDYLAMNWTEDEELRQRKSDKAFTCLFPWLAVRAGPEELTRLTHDGRESGKDEHALYKRDDHKRRTDESVRLALAYKASRDNASG